MRENRVRVADIGRIDSATDPRLVPVPSIPGKTCKLHNLAAAAFCVMAAACYNDTHIQIKAASGWRPHRWRSRAEYERYLVTHYGTVSDGKRWVAYDSPHETGLAVDIGTGGLSPDSKTAAEQKQTDLYQWLCNHAESFGFTPYLPEPWHWEYNISRAEWERT